MKETEELLGMFVNVALLHADLTGNPTFLEFLSKTREDMLADSEHYDTPFASLVERLKTVKAPGRNPVFQVLFAFHDSAVPLLDFAGLKGRLLEIHNHTAKMDMNVICIPRAEQHVTLGAASRSAALFTVLALCRAALADTVGGGFSGGNTADGNLFDFKVTSPGGIRITGLELNRNTTSQPVDFYYRPGTVGATPTDMTGLILFQRNNPLAGSGFGTATPFPLDKNLVLPAGNYVFLITDENNNDGDTQSLNTTLAISNADLTYNDIAGGQQSRHVQFNGSVLNITGSPRRFEGRITYTVIPTNEPVTILTEPADVTLLENHVFTLSVEVDGASPYSYQWTHAGTNLLGATNAVFTKNAALSDAGNYTVIVGGAAGNSVTSRTAVVTVNPDNLPPTLVSQTGDATRYFGGHVTFGASLTGTAPFTYQWKHAGTNLPGATAVSLTLTNLAAAQAGTYQLAVTNAFGHASTTNVLLSLLAAVPGSYEEMIVTNKPFAYWRLDEADPNPPVAYDYAGGNDLANNASGASTTGLQPPTYPGFESTNAAGAYNGFSGVSQAPGTLMNSMTRFTICGWFNMLGTPVWGTSLFGQNDLAELGFAPKLSIWVPASPSGSAYIEYSGTINNGQWYFVAAVADGTSLLLYVNGSQVASAPLAAFATTSASPFRIGSGTIFDGGVNAPYGFFNGTIDEVALFDRAVSATQINGLYTKALGVAPPGISTDPVSKTIYAGRTVTFKVQASGSEPLTYKWMKGASYLSNGGRISGANSNVLTITSLVAADEDYYMVEVSNPAGTAYSLSAQLTVVPAPTTRYDAKVLSLNPLSYWSLNEPYGPTAFDYCGGLDGTYGAAALMGDTILGPRSPEFYGFSTSNTALGSQGLANSATVIPPLNLTTTNFTLVAWLNPAELETWRGIIYSRGSSGNVAGFNLAGNANELHYTWKDTYWDWNSGLVLPANAWSFVALVVEPTKATLYLGAPGQALATAVNVAPHAAMTFGSYLSLGQDSAGGGYYNGQIDEVSLFNRSLTSAEVESLYANGSGVVTLHIVRSGSNVVLTWPFGTLQAADEATGTYNNVSGATSPWPVNATAARKFFRVTVP